MSDEQRQRDREADYLDDRQRLREEERNYSGDSVAACAACGGAHPLVLLCGEQAIECDGETLLVACSRRPNVRHGRPIACTGSTHRPGGWSAVCSCECHGGVAC